jgi:hypothetical protein
MSEGKRINRDWYSDKGLEYESALHGMQSAVAFENSRLPAGYDFAKHLRVGVNSAMVETAALALLLIEKGIFTEQEWNETLRLLMNNELSRYEDRLPEDMRGKVKFL